MTHRGRSIVLVGLLSILAFARPVFADDKPVVIRGVDVEGYPNIAVNVTVASSTLPEDIQVTENGSAVPILTVRPLIQSGQEIDVVLAIDTSRSIRGAPLRAAIAAAKTFLAGLPQGVPVGVLTFSTQVRTLLQITPEHATVLKTLDSIESTEPGTALYDAVEAAAAMFSGNAQHNILLLTDGRDSGSRNDLPGAIAAAQHAHAAAFTIGLQGIKPDFTSLQTLATKTGGSFAPAATGDLAKVYADLASRLSRQYLILYRSHSPGGSQVTVAVQAPGGTDTSIVLMPRLRTPVGSAGKRSQPLLVGHWALATILSLSFAAVFFLLFLPLEGWIRARRDRVLATRMRAQPAGDTPAREGPGRSLTSWIPTPMVQGAERVAEMAGFRASLDKRLEAAGLPIRAGELLAISVIGAVVAGTVVQVLLQSVLFAIPLGAIIAAIPFFLLAKAIDRRINALNEQLPDVLLILASSMRAGHSFLQALDTVSKEIGDPSGPEFARVVAEIRLGRPFDEAMNAMAERVGSEEFKWAMLAVNIQREVGGNLAEILDTLAETVRDREAVRRQIKVLSSEGRLSVRILVALPFLITLYVIKVNPTYMRLLWTTWVGLVMIGIGGFLMVAGVIWARKIVKIDV